MFQDWYENLVNCILKGARRKDDYWLYLKAKSKLAKELDIKKFITNIHLVQNAVKFLTTQNQRKLLKMTANKNIVVLAKEDKEKLEKSIEQLSLTELT